MRMPKASNGRPWGRPLPRGGVRLLLFFFCGLSVLIVVHAAPQNRTLVLTGQPGEVPVVEMDGRSYVEIEALTRLLNGSVRFRGGQIVLTLPSPGAATAARSPEAGEAASAGFSKEFLKAAIEEMGVVREWRRTLLNTIRQGMPVTELWVASSYAEAQRNLRLVSLAASTEADRNTMQLLTNVVNNLKTLSDRFADANKSRTYVPPDVLDNDPLDKRIVSCAHSLAAMAANNQFMDDGSCH